jgi:hypothetical protein
MSIGTVFTRRAWCTGVLLCEPAEARHTQAQAPGLVRAGLAAGACE